MNRDLFRFLLDETDDKGDQQFLKGKGLKGEELTGVHRIQPFGFHSVVPKGAHGFALSAHGMRDLVVMLGVEHKEYRPREREVGSQMIYDANGSVVSLVKTNIRIRHAEKIEHVAGSDNGGARIIMHKDGRVEINP